MLDANIFRVVFDFDEWPGNHYNDEECIRPYNGSLFFIRSQYKDVVPEQDFSDMSERKDLPFDQKFYKIKYSINLLPAISSYIKEDPESKEKVEMNEDISMVSLLSETEELEVFHTDSIQQMLDYKWETFGKDHHILGCFMHLFYTLMVILYVKDCYIV